MPKQAGSSTPGESQLGAEVEDQLRAAFKALPHDMPVFLFTDGKSKDPLGAAAKQMMRLFRNLSDRIKVKEYDMDHPEARKWNVTGAPTFLFDPERYSIRYMGTPFGEEGRTFLGALILIGSGTGSLSEQSRKVLKKIDSPRDVKVFVSPTCPYCPEQAINAIRAAIENPEFISLEIIDIQANPELADKYGAFSVPQTFANDVLIAQGAQTEELFLLSLEKMEQQNVFIPESDAAVLDVDLVIVGGGPAGLTAGIYAVRSGLRTAVVEAGQLGGQVAATPIVENYPGFTRVPGKTLVDILVSHALEYTEIFQGEKVLEIIRGDPLEVRTTRRKFLTRAVILATGAEYKKLGVPGEARLAGRGVSYCATCDGPLFKGKKVIVVGGGNSAATEALYLHNIGVGVTMVHRRDTFRAQEHLTRNVLGNNIPVFWDTEVKEIRGKERVSEVELFNGKTGRTQTVPTDGVFIAVGYSPTVELALKAGVEITPDGFIKHDSHHRTNIPGIYSAGDVEGGYKQIVTAMSQGTEAALSVFEDLKTPYWLSEAVVKAAG
ncbi:FAD-dependent oxidoreductase [Syntrophobacter fumaroxidans]|uniref:FAD-dependent pyridine nucleotide-disulphide oxidoreductase n=1 Tax=Syntrophobacter fumaroxidans (strain DSM 10017 / MPOB) TaxID=335543 RepID=A0LQ41_SYNFM|nr:FAD-dependent oxidoreductase [Syntrophobacter fumaroxidans]ABK19543.1 FAD-dependent pyridine nucleotide-disulphide oxidoreductase [Syntrophobacter fumaroxidans MPOB]